MTFLDQLIETLKEIASQQTDDASITLTCKVMAAKALLSWLSPTLGLISFVFASISNAELNDMLRTVYISIAILFISLSLIWAGWKNKTMTVEILGYFKALKNKKQAPIKPPSQNDGSDPGHEIINPNPNL